MRISTFAFTEEGKKTEKRICETLLHVSFRGDKVTDIISRGSKEVELAFADSECLVFVGATGIAVRLCAPHLASKLTDPAIILVDETASFVIPLASGHVGGANGLSRILAKALYATPVITTATDVEGVFSVDEFAAANELSIQNKDDIKRVAKKLLSRETVSIAFSDDVLVTSSDEESEDSLLHLLMRPYVVGMGCKKGKSFEELEDFFLDTLQTAGVPVKDVIALASIDVKKDEEGLILLAKKYNMKFVTYSAEELRAVEGDFEESAFVEATVGVSDVSGRAAKKCGGSGKFVVKKEKCDGMTISVFEKLRRINLKYE